MLTDLDGRVVQSNSAFSALVGYDEAELLGRPISELIHPADRANNACSLRELLDGTRDSVVITKRLLHRSGAEIWGDVNIALVRNESGMPIMIVRMTEDCSERKRVQDERDRLFNLSLDMLCVANFDGWFMQVNPSWTRILGWSSDELKSRPLIEFVHPDDRGKTLDVRAGIIIPGAPVREFENRYVCKDGSVRWLSWNVHPIVELRQIFAVARDITERKQEEDERRRLEARIMRAQRMEGIGTLAGGIAHDLNNVLAPILLSVEMLKSESINETQRDILDTIDVSARRGAEMVRQVLSYARGVEGDRIPLSLASLMRDVQRLVRERFMSSVTLRSELPADLWSLHGDATQLQQVLLNLCLNARDAMADGGTLTISARNATLQQAELLDHDSSPGDFVVVDVRDTGTGISPEHLEQIFDPFFTTKGIGEGSGLGLSTSHAIVRSHGGFIQVETALGVGTVFRLYLRATSAPLPQLPVNVPVIAVGAHECVLVVDDEAPIRRVLQSTLERYGYRVLLANNGAEALEIFAARSAEIHVVVTDLMMPVMDGLAVIRAIRAQAPELRIIAVSGLATKERREEVLQQGASHFLAKPFTTDTLLSTVRTALDQKLAI